MKRRIPVFGILIILIGISFTPLNQGMNIGEAYHPISTSNTLYVGGTGPDNYTKIQDAIDNASDGDIVFVFDDSSPYYENNILIEKSINLIGEDKYTTIIDGNASGDIFNITADRVTISQFMIQNTSRYKIALKILSDSNSIINNIIWKNWYGIYFDNSNKNTIKGNNISKNHYGITTEFSHKNFIIDNILTSNNYYGIETLHSNNNTIMNNNIMLNNLSGIQMYRSNFNTISYNRMETNYYWADMYLMDSEYNIIKFNNISNSRDGIRLQRCYNNIILGNNIFSYSHPDGNGLVIYWESTDNIIYHNNFINSIQHAHDENSNDWDNDYPSGGNYWDDYEGVDNFSGPNQDIPGSDGIGDTPYPIPMGNNEDRYPLMEPWNLTYPVANFTYFAGESPVLFNGSSSYDLDGYIVSYEWDFGDGTTGEGKIAYHKYCEVGTYYVTLTITDDDGLTGNITKCVDVLIENIPPTLDIYGPNHGKPGVTYDYVFINTDLDKDDLMFYIRWGDNSVSPWIGPLAYGESIIASHDWSEVGTYVINTTLKDFCGEWDGSTLEVSIPRTRASSFHWLLERFPLLERLVGLIRVI